ncbi:MAG: MauE/DoxX family redox-associated membrane protein [Streptosporangiaceae bacterium]
MSQGALLLAGYVASSGAVLVLAGLSKLYRGVRGIDGGTAIRRALRMPRRRWRRAEMAVGGLECLTGTAVCAGVYPVAGGAAMAALGAVFCVLLGYARIKRVPGGCGCMNWRKATAAAAVTWRAIARGGLLLGAGVAAAIAGTTRASGIHHAWFDAGILAGSLIFVLLSTRLVARTPVCHRRLWRPARATLRVLAAHETFAAMAASAGPFGSVAGYRRDGCTEEFWLTPATGSGGTEPGGTGAVMFRVSYPAPDAPPAVHASLQDVRAMTAGRPPRMISVPNALANH